MWLGPAPYAPYTPERVHFNFRWIWDYSGGIICDWGTHLFDTAQWGNDTEHTGPVEIKGTGTVLGRRAVRHGQGLRRNVQVRQRRCDDLYAGQPQHQVHRQRRLGRQPRLAGAAGGQLRRDPELRDRPGRNPPVTNPEGEHRDFLDCVKSRKTRTSPWTSAIAWQRLSLGQHRDQAGRLACILAVSIHCHCQPP
jgi:predicted dehydrogenase